MRNGEKNTNRSKWVYSQSKWKVRYPDMVDYATMKVSMRTIIHLETEEMSQGNYF